jgi:hypothetical protein
VFHIIFVHWSLFVHAIDFPFNKVLNKIAAVVIGASKILVNGFSINHYCFCKEVMPFSHV